MQQARRRSMICLYIEVLVCILATQANTSLVSESWPPTAVLCEHELTEKCCCVLITRHFSGPGRATGPVCVRLSVRILTCELNDI